MNKNLMVGNNLMTIEDVKDMLMHLEDEYRKANISEKSYAELKEKYSKILEKFGKSEKKVSDPTDIKLKNREKEDVEMFLESLEEQYEKGEINKNDYENIKNVNMQRLKEIKDGLGEESGEVEIEIKKKEKEGVFKKLFGRLRKKKMKEGKLEVEVPEDVPATEEDVEEKPPEDNEEVEIEVKKGLLHGMLNKIKGERKLEVNIPEDVEKIPEQISEGEVMESAEEGNKEIEDEPKEEVAESESKDDNMEKTKETEPKPEDVPKEEPEKIEELPKEETEKQEPEAPKEQEPKKSGFFKSIFKKKDKKKEEMVPEEQKAETEIEKVQKQEPKVEEKKEEKLEPGEIEEVTPEVIEKLAAQMAADSGTTAENVETTPEEVPEEESPASDNKMSIELEKLKIMIDTVRESKKATDDTIQNISENIGEIRSMVMQADANFKTSMAKMESLEDDVSDIRPKEISKKFNEIKESMEKDRLEMEKIKRKSDGTLDKVNEIYDMIKSIGGIENLVNVNNDIQTKLKDINDAIKYIQRIGSKTEKIFIDLSKGMEDLVLLKAKQEDFDETIKNALASIDSLNVKLKDYVSKSDMENVKQEFIMIKKQIDEVKKVLPVAELKLPENMIKLRKDKEDIEMFLESLETQRIEGKISKAEYEELKRINVKKLDDIMAKLQKEWKDIDRVMKPEEEEGETTEDSQGDVVKKRKSKRKSKSKKNAKSERDRKKKILKDLKING